MATDPAQHRAQVLALGFNEHFAQRAQRRRRLECGAPRLVDRQQVLLLQDGRPAGERDRLSDPILGWRTLPGQE